MLRSRLLASISIALLLCLFSSKGITDESDANEQELSTFQECVLADEPNCLAILGNTHNLTIGDMFPSFDGPSLDQEAQFRWRWSAIWSDLEGAW